MIADQDEAITVESVAEGLKVYDNPVGVMTNNPPFPYQMFRAEPVSCSFSPSQPENHLRRLPLAGLQPRHGGAWTSG